jgi:protein TonB
MIDLADVQFDRLKPKKTLPEVKRKSDARRRVIQESSPRGDMPRDRLSRPISPKAEGGQVSKPEPRRMEAGQEKTERPIRPESSVENALRRPTPRKEEMARLFPGASNLALMEESYRRKYAAEVEERDTTFLNTDDIQFGSFLRRFEDAVYGVWRYPQAAAKLGIEGVTAVRITFNRRGEVARYDVLEGSGSRILDDEVGRVLRMVGTVGPFPRGYDKEEYHLIAFFRYSIVGGTIRGTLR